ncbi:MAG: molecular chaperone TorD family protein [Anaerolineae bacterium]|nr:molecular chaperone TorD family protein [Anaerolineae bacterium]
MPDRQLIYQARQAVYGLFQRLYQAPPDDALLHWLQTEQPFVEFPIPLDDDTASALEMLQTACAELTAGTLREDFRQLYVGPGPMTAPPWESVYRNEEHLLFDSHTLAVREFYARHGMEFVRKNETPEDTIDIELEFMRILTERQILALEKGDSKAERILVEEQQAFLKEHLLVWAPRFARLTRHKAQTVFYARLVDVLEAFLTWDAAALEELLGLLPEEPGEPA